MEYVEYIQSIGTQYINTGVVPTANTVVEMKYSVQEIKNLGPHMLSNSAWYFPFPRSYGGTAHFFTNMMGTQERIELTPEIDKEYTIKAYPDGQVIINDVVYTTLESGTTTGTAELHMFTYSGAPSNVSYTASAKVYYCKIWEGGTLVRDFKPALNDNGVVGLYDEVNAQFYGNDGIGVFQYMPLTSTDYSISSKTLIGIANEIRIKNRSANKISVTNIANEISNIVTADAIIEGTLAGDYYNNRITSVAPYGLANLTQITSVDFPECSSIGGYGLYFDNKMVSANIPKVKTVGNYAFAYCYSLKSVDLPICSNVSSNAFLTCSALTSVDLPICTTISSSAFKNCSSLQSINASKCTTIGSNAFLGCSKLTSASFPVCTTIGSSAFYGCSCLTHIDFPMYSGTVYTSLFGGSYQLMSLSTVNFPKCTSVGSSAFFRCGAINSINFQQCKQIGTSAFAYCTELKSASFPVCTTIGSNAMAYCTKLTSISLPVCSAVGSYAFNCCYSLTSITLPVCSIISHYTFQNCSSLTYVDLPECRYIYSFAFRYCSNLMSLVLRASTVVALYSPASTFAGTPMLNSTYTGNFGSIYVPASLVSAYIASGSWSSLSSRITSIIE